MIENNEENREKLAQLVVDSMDFHALFKYVKDSFIEKFEEDNDLFEYNLQWHTDEDGNLYE